MKRKHLLFTLLLAFVVSLAANAQTGVPIGDLLYTLNATAGTARVTGHVYGPSATGSLTIPATVVYDNTMYTVDAIAQNAFNSCTGFTGTLVIPSSITSIGSTAFAGCTGFTGTLVIPSSVTGIGQAAFGGCTGFTGLEFDNYGSSLTMIQTQAFRDCTGMRGNLALPTSLTHIGNRAFMNCGFNGNLMLRANVQVIGTGAFANCSFTSMRVIPDTPPTLGDDVFSGINADILVTVTQDYSVINTYRTTPGWDYFNNYFKFEANGMFYQITDVANHTVAVTCPIWAAASNYYWTGYTEPAGEIVIPQTVTDPNTNTQYTVTSVGDEAYETCPNITGVTFPSTITAIGMNAFRDCTGLTTIVLPSGVNEIDACAFQNCTSLTQINVLASTPPTLGNNAFYNVTNTIPVYVPSGCVSAYQAASGWSNFTNILEANYDFSAVAPTGQTLYYIIADATNHKVKVTHPAVGYTNFWNGFTQPSGDLTIPSTVTNGGVTYTVTAIDDNAFNACAGINGLVLPNTLESIGDHAFRLCTGTTGTLNFPASLTHIGTFAFGSCGFTGTLTVPSTLTAVPNSAFQFCAGFTSLVIPNTITAIGDYAFTHCTGLTGELVIPESVTYIGTEAFHECTGFTGELIIPNSVTTIGPWAFYHCTGFTGDLLIPNSVTSIGTLAFYDCTGFNRSLIFPARPERNLHIGDYAFKYCLNIVEIISCGETPPTPVGTDDNVNAFAEMEDVVTLNIPTVGWHAYRTCKYFNAIPATESRRKTLYDFKRVYNGNTYYYNVKTKVAGFSHIYTNNFVPGLLYSLPNDSPFRTYWKVFLTCPGTQLNPYGGFEKPQGPIDIEEYFTDQTITIPYGPGSNINVSLTQHYCILTGVESKAFYGCDGLTGFILFDSFPYYDQAYFEGIGADAFNGCTGLTQVAFAMPGKLAYSIGARAFYGCTGLTGNLALLGEINSIGDYAFYGCTNLDGKFDVGKPYGSNISRIKEIGVSAFENCNFIGGLKLRQVNAIHESAFKNSGFDGALRLYGYDSGCNDQIIENEAFMNCRFSSIDISEVPHTIIGDYAFSGCQYAQGDIVLHRNVKTIGAHAFDGCTSLDGSLTIHDLSEMETIGNAAFKNCQFSGQLFLPTTVSTIGAEAFAGNDEITSIVYLGELNNAQSNSFTGMVNTIPIYINNEYVEQLPQSVGWNYFSNYQSYHNLPYSPHTALGQWVAIEDNPVGTINTEWSRIVTPANAGYIQRQRATSVGGLDTYNLVMGCNSSANPSQSSPVTMVAMLPMIADPINMAMLTFGLQSSSVLCQPFEVGYVLNNDPSSFVTYRNYEPSATWQEIEVSYNGVPRNARMAFRYKVTSSGAKGTSWSVSTLFNLAVKVSATDLAAYGYDGNSITFEWWAQGGEQWEIQYRGYPSIGLGYDVNGTYTVDQNPFTTDGWNYSICWVKVRAVGHDSENEPYYSDWSDEIEFCPGCEAMDSYSEGFENVTVSNWDNTLPDCWLHYDMDNPYPQSHCNYAHTGIGCLAMGVWDQTPYSAIPVTNHWDDQYCILPEIASLDQKKMTFWAKYPSQADYSGGGAPHPVNSNGYTTTLKVGYVTDLGNVYVKDSFVPIGEIELTENYVQYSFLLYNVPAEGARLCFCMLAEPEKNIYAMIDDLVVEDRDECDLLVENFRVYSPGYTTAYVNWDDLEGLTQVEIQYWAVWELDPVSQPYQPTSIIVSNTQKPFKVTGLTPGQSYEFRARQYCGNESQGDWTDRMPIRMMCYDDYQSTPYAEGFSDNEMPSCWILRDGSNGKVGVEQKALRLHPTTGDCGVYMPKMTNLPSMKLSINATRRVFLNSAVHVRICTNIDHPEGNTIDLVTIGQLETAPYQFTNTTYQNYEIHFSTFNNIPDEGYIEFYCESDPYPGHDYTGTCDVMIDDILVYEEVAINMHFVGASTVDPTDWHIAQNWDPVGVPTAIDNVYIDDNNQVVISQPAEANNVDFNTYKSSITIKGNGQLNFQYGHDRPGQLHNKKYLTLKFEKEIQAYTPGERDGYYLINIPCYEHTLTTKVNDYLPLTLSGSSAFDPNTDAYTFIYWNDLEWHNLKTEDEAWIKGWTQGILFARAVNTTLQYNGVEVACGGERMSRELAHPYGNYEFMGWNLIGNPYSCDAYVVDIRSNSIPYYRMNGAGDAIILAEEGSPIGVLEGFFVVASHPGETVYVETTPPVNQGRSFDLTLSKRNPATNRDGATRQVTLDRARVSFGGDNNIGHFDGLASSNRLYIPMDGEEMSLVQGEPTGELPINFEVGANGQYTIDFSNHVDDLTYCHLIDNLTGADVNLLEVPEYNFSAKTTDYASRFKLVFATGSSEGTEADTFGFINASGNFCIFGIEGEATVQVIDMLGHVISSETFSGSYERKINGAPGVYLVRLINGENVRVQKVVVR